MLRLQMLNKVATQGSSQACLYGISNLVFESLIKLRVDPNFCVFFYFYFFHTPYLLALPNIQFHCTVFDFELSVTGPKWLPILAYS